MVNIRWIEVKFATQWLHGQFGGNEMPRKKERPAPKVGQVYERKYKRKNYRMVVVKTKSGIGFQVGGQVFPTPTAAAKAVVGQHQSISGPKFWRMD
jgi:hypothetical protein